MSPALIKDMDPFKLLQNIFDFIHWKISKDLFIRKRHCHSIQGKLVNSFNHSLVQTVDFRVKNITYKENNYLRKNSIVPAIMPQYIGIFFYFIHRNLLHIKHFRLPQQIIWNSWCLGRNLKWYIPTDRNLYCYFFRYLGILSYYIDCFFILALTYTNLYQYLSPLAYKTGTKLILKLVCHSFDSLQFQLIMYILWIPPGSGLQTRPLPPPTLVWGSCCIDVNCIYKEYIDPTTYWQS